MKGDHDPLLPADARQFHNETKGTGRDMELLMTAAEQES